jgi:hypothetical protein
VSCTRWMACARNKLWWMTPEWGTTMDELPTETQFLLLEHGSHGVYSILLPLIEGSFRSTLKAERDRYYTSLGIMSSSLMSVSSKKQLACVPVSIAYSSMTYIYRHASSRTAQRQFLCIGQLANMWPITFHGCHLLDFNVNAEDTT